MRTRKSPTSAAASGKGSVTGKENTTGSCDVLNQGEQTVCSPLVSPKSFKDQCFLTWTISPIQNASASHSGSPWLVLISPFFSSFTVLFQTFSVYCSSGRHAALSTSCLPRGIFFRLVSCSFSESSRAKIHSFFSFLFHKKKKTFFFPFQFHSPSAEKITKKSTAVGAINSVPAARCCCSPCSRRSSHCDRAIRPGAD
jgi:hypothetical protein